MSDDIRLNAGTGGKIVAADDVSGSMYQRIKLAVGLGGKAADVNFQNALPITVGDGGGTDAFGRLRVSNPETLFESQHEYDKNDLFWSEKTVGSSSSAHVPDESLVRMTVGSNTNDSIIRQTLQYWRYQPGKSQLVLLTFGFGTLSSDLRARAGYFDGDNGIYFENSGTTPKIVRRSKVSGSVVNTEVDRADWNDSMDGSGASGLDLDFTKSQIVLIDLEWLAVGRVRVGFVVDGRPVIAYAFNNANTIAGAYMSTANLPIRYELVNVGGGASDSIDMICSTVISEGGKTPTGLPFSANTGTTLKTLSSRLALVSIRPKATFAGRTNRGTIIPFFANILSETKGALIEVVYNGTLGGTPSWNSANDDSIVEFDTAGTAVTGGIVTGSFFLERNASERIDPDFLSKLPLALDIDGANPTIISLVGSTAGGGGNADVGGAIKWGEER